MESFPMDPVLQAVHIFTTPRKRAETAEDIESLNGAARFSMTYGAIELNYCVWGMGAPVLLLHGWESRASHMAGFVPGLVRAGFSVIALDAPAHGDSTGTKTNAVDYGRAVTHFSRHFGDIVAVIGHSVGSAAALYAFAHGLRVKASVHLCGPASMSRVIRRGGKAGGLDEASLDRLEIEMEKEVGAPLNILGLESLKPGMKHPSLLMHDPKDQEMPFEESLILSKAWLGSTLKEIQDVGHRRILRSTSVIEASVEFIQRHSK
jgi:predicted alpha/beta hydrolase family esterase